MDHRTLRLTARAKLTTGALPRDRPTRTWGGIGSGSTCAVCEGRVERTSAEIEAAGADGQRRFYHAACYVLLSTERAELRE